MSYGIHYRIKPEGQFLKEGDYIHGFGMDFSLYKRICDKREEKKAAGADILTKKDFQENYDLREGFAIDGTPFQTKYHPLLGRTIRNNESGDTYIVEGFYKHFHFGYYWVVLMRREGTQSHAVIYWENVNCKDTTTIEIIKENTTEYTLL